MCTPHNKCMVHIFHWSSRSEGRRSRHGYVFVGRRRHNEGYCVAASCTARTSKHPSAQCYYCLENALTPNMAVSLQLLSQLCPQVVHSDALVSESLALITFLLQQSCSRIHLFWNLLCFCNLSFSPGAVIRVFFRRSLRTLCDASRRSRYSVKCS